MCCIRIERAQNGFTVCATDPKIAAENDKSNSRWKDPQREYVFKTITEAVEFVEKIADIALPEEKSPPDPFAAAFKEAASSDDDGDE